MALTDAKARAAKARESAYKLADEKGLHLFVRPTGSRIWRMKYRFGGKEKLLTFGPYPEVSLAQARDMRDEARRLLRDGIDPSVARRRPPVADSETTFEAVARTWHDLNKSRWAPVHAEDVLHSLERDVFKGIGSMQLRDITAPTVLEVLRKIEARPSIETARRVRQRISAVFVYAIASGLCDNDPAAIVKGALAPLPRKRKQPAITDVEEARTMLAKVEREGASPVTKLAMRLLALTAVRPGVLRGAKWDEFEDLDSDAPLWRIPAPRMKLPLHRKHDDTFEHLVPLSRQAIEVLAVLRGLSGGLPYVFPNARHSHKPMSENALGYLLNRAGYNSRHCAHGWRSTFSTVMNERAEREGRASDRAIIDLMLAHVPENEVEVAYNRAAYMPRRREIAQEWADILIADMPSIAGALEGKRR